MCTAHGDPRSSRRIPYFGHIQFYFFVRLESFRLHLFGFGKYRIDLPDIDGIISAVISLYCPGYDVPFLHIILVKQNFSLLFAYFLNDNLFCFLCRNTSEIFRCHLDAHIRAELFFSIFYFCFHDGNLKRLVFYLFHYFFILIYMEFPRIFIQGNTDVIRFAKLVFARCQQGILYRLYQNVFTDIFFFFNRL